MARPEVTGRKLSAVVSDDEGDAFSVAEFCRRHRISPQLFYKFKDQMPVTFRVGTRVLISREAAAAWRTKRETASAAEAEVKAEVIRPEPKPAPKAKPAAIRAARRGKIKLAPRTKLAAEADA